MSYLKKTLVLSAKNSTNIGLAKLTLSGDTAKVLVSLSYRTSGKITVVVDVNGVRKTSENCDFSINTSALDNVAIAVYEDSTLSVGGATSGYEYVVSELKLQPIKTDVIKEQADLISQTQSTANSTESAQTDEFSTKKADVKQKALDKPTINASPVQNEKPSTRVKTSSQSNSGSTASFNFDEGIAYNGDNFYIAVKPQLDEMFVCYPSENHLNEIVTNSKWIKVDCEEDYYVVGIICDDDNVPLFLCYGIHGNYNQRPPKEIENISQWLPVESELDGGNGYWIIYQDAKTGKCKLKDIV